MCVWYFWIQIYIYHESLVCLVFQDSDTSVMYPLSHLCVWYFQIQICICHEPFVCLAFQDSDASIMNPLCVCYFKIQICICQESSVYLVWGFRHSAMNFVHVVSGFRHSCHKLCACGFRIQTRQHYSTDWNTCWTWRTACRTTTNVCARGMQTMWRWAQRCQRSLGSKKSWHGSGPMMKTPVTRILLSLQLMWVLVVGAASFSVASK